MAIKAPTSNDTDIGGILCHQLKENYLNILYIAY